MRALPALQPLQQVRVPLGGSWGGVDGCAELLEGLSLQLEVGSGVDAEGLEVGVAQDVLDGHRVDARLEHVHRLRVPEGVGADAGPVEARELLGREPAILAHQVGQPGPRHRLSKPVADERGAIITRAPGLDEVLPRELGGAVHQRHEPLLVALAADRHERVPMQS